METKKRGAGTVYGHVTNKESDAPSPKRHKRKGGSNRLMLQKSFQYITSMHYCTEFAQVANTDREDTISIFSRRVNTKKLTESSTTYGVLRSWVQDDPDRTPPESSADVAVSEGVSKAAEDPLVIHLTEVLDQCASRKETSQADIFKSINSLSNIPASELLLTHVSYYQKIREIWLMIAALRYSYIREKLLRMGAPTITAMDRILQQDNGDISLKSLTALLKLPEPSQVKYVKNSVVSSGAALASKHIGK